MWLLRCALGSGAGFVAIQIDVDRISVGAQTHLLCYRNAYESCL
jgi:hypothetical protein